VSEKAILKTEKIISVDGLDVIAIIKTTQKNTLILLSLCLIKVMLLDEKKWGDTLSMLMKYASEIFGSIEGFKKGRVIVEAEGDKAILKIAIWKDRGGELKLSFEYTPAITGEEKAIEFKEKVEEEKPKPEQPMAEEKTSTEVPVEAEELGELGELFKDKEEKEETFGI